MSDSNSKSAGPPRYRSEHTPANKLRRALWGVVWILLVRPVPGVSFLRAWPTFWARLFGARIAPGATVSPSCRIWAPWNLEMGPGSSLSDFVNCYNVGPIRLGRKAVVSQYTHLCAVSHDIRDSGLKLVTAPIVVGDNAWVGMAAFVGRGVTVGEGAVVGAFAGAYKDVAPWTIVGGNPAKVIGQRQPF